jgi:hypothetical protein
MSVLLEQASLFQIGLKVFSLLRMFDEREDNKSPNIDQNSSPKERVKKSQRNKLLSQRDCPASWGIH